MQKDEIKQYSIHTLKSPVLRTKSSLVSKITFKEKKIFKEMEQLMRKEKGVGLAAPQIGIALQLIVVDANEGVICLANPKILKKKGGLFKAEEGCLSLPGINVAVKRAQSVIIEALDKEGQRIKLEADNLLARILQHEIDHLQGRLIIDYLPWYKRLISRMKSYMRIGLAC